MAENVGPKLDSCSGKMEASGKAVQREKNKEVEDAKMCQRHFM